MFPRPLAQSFHSAPVCALRTKADAVQEWLPWLMLMMRTMRMAWLTLCCCHAVAQTFDCPLLLLLQLLLKN